MTTMNEEKEIIRQAMKIMGSRKSPRKTRAVRLNAKLGGAPRIYTRCIKSPYHRFSASGICYGCGKTKKQCLI